MFALGLPGFCTFLYMVRVLQAMQDTRTAFRIYLVENAINIVLGVALVGPLGVRGLALSVSIAYTVAAVIALSVVARKDDGLGGHELTTPVTRVLVATAVMAVATVLAVNVSAANVRASPCSAGGGPGRGGRGPGLRRHDRGPGHPRGPPGRRRPVGTGRRRPPRPSSRHRRRSMRRSVPAGAGPDGPPARAAHSSHPARRPADAGRGRAGEMPDDSSADPVPWQTRRRVRRRLRCAICARCPADGGSAHGRSGGWPDHRRCAGGGSGGRAAPGRRGGTPWPGSGW